MPRLERSSFMGGLLAAAGLVCFSVMVEGTALGQEAHTDFWTRRALLDGPGSPKEALRQNGIQLEGSLTQFYQGVAAGDGNKSWQYGGKVDIGAVLDGRKLGFWPGLSISIHQDAGLRRRCQQPG